jgi:hypothetical protein
MKIRFVQPYMGQYKVGDVIDPGDGPAATYIRRGLCVLHENPTDKSLDKPNRDKSFKRETAERKAEV